MPTPVDVEAKWYELIRPTKPQWEELYPDDPPVIVRGSLGKTILTVWLPEGARIRARINKRNNDPMNQTFYHYFGFNCRQKIMMKIKGVRNA